MARSWFALARKKWFIAVAAAVFLLAAIPVFRVSNDAGTGNDEHAVSAAHVQEFAAQFKQFHAFTEDRGLAPMAFRDSSGRMLSVDDYRGQFILLHFWATWCAPCAAELPLLDRFYVERTGTETGMTIIPVSVDFDMPVVRLVDFMKKNEAGALPVIVGVQNAAIWEIVSGGLPASLIMSPDGRVLYKAGGEADWTSPATRAFFDDLLNTSHSR